VDFEPLSPEDVQRTVQFLLNQQAQFAADLAASQARFDAGQAQFDARLEALSAKTDRVADGLIGLTTIVGQVVDSVSKIAEVQKRTTEQVERTDSHLDVVIQMFERHLREDHGRSPS
jgi:ABC-type transporter Mla subunit MlaD